MNSKRVLVPGSSSGLPAQIERRTRIANRVLGELERQDTEAFFRRHPEFFWLVVSRYYPLDEGLIGRFEDCWDWSLLSCNENLRWDIGLVGRFEKTWDWRLLSRNEALPWTEELLEKHQDHWNWGSWSIDDGGLSLNKSLPWSNKLLERFRNRWNWDLLILLCQNICHYSLSCCLR